MKTNLKKWSRLLFIVMMVFSLTAMIMPVAVQAAFPLDDGNPCCQNPECQLLVNLVTPADKDQIAVGSEFWVNAIVARPAGFLIVSGVTATLHLGVNAQIVSCPDPSPGPTQSGANLDSCNPTDDFWWKVECTGEGPLTISVTGAATGATTDPAYAGFTCTAPASYTTVPITVQQYLPPCDDCLDVTIIECPDGPILPGTTFAVKANVCNYCDKDIVSGVAWLKIEGPAQLDPSSPQGTTEMPGLINLGEIRKGQIGGTECCEEVGWTFNCTGGDDVKITVKASAVYEGENRGPITLLQDAICVASDVCNAHQICSAYENIPGQTPKVNAEVKLTGVPAKVAVCCAPDFTITANIKDLCCDTGITDIVATITLGGNLVVKQTGLQTDTQTNCPDIDPCGTGTISWVLHCTGPDYDPITNPTGNPSTIDVTITAKDGRTGQPFSFSATQAKVKQLGQVIVNMISPAKDTKINVCDAFDFKYQVSNASCTAWVFPAYAGIILSPNTAIATGGKVKLDYYVCGGPGTPATFDRTVLVTPTLITGSEYHVPIDCLCPCCYVQVTWPLICTGSDMVNCVAGSDVITAIAGADGDPQTVYVYNLQPQWDALGGGGVYSVYYGPPDYNAISPGLIDVYDGRQAGPIYAGVTIDPIDNMYEDQGLFAFKPGDVPISTFATQPLTYDFINQYGTAPVWVYIELNKNLPGDIMYQYVPTSNPASWHTEDAATGTHWQAWTNLTDGITTGPMMSLADIATANPGKTVSRVYLTEGMGDSYHSTPYGTVAWIDKVTIGSVIYDFVTDPFDDSDTVKVIQMSPAALEGALHVFEGTITDGDFEGCVETRSVVVGEYYTVVAAIENIGEATANGVVVTINANGAVTPNGDLTQTVGDLPCHGSKKVTWTFKCEGQGPVTFSMTALTGTDGNTNAAIAPACAKRGCPVTVDQICFTVEMIQPILGEDFIVGDTFTIKAKICNCDTNAVLQNAFAELNWKSKDGEKTGFILVQGQGNPIALGGIDGKLLPGECAEVTWQVQCDRPGDVTFWVEAYNANPPNPTCPDCPIINLDTATPVYTIHQWEPGSIGCVILSPSMENNDDCFPGRNIVDAYIGTGEQFVVTAKFFNTGDRPFTIDGVNLDIDGEGDVDIVSGPTPNPVGEVLDPHVHHGPNDVLIVSWTLQGSDAGSVEIEVHVWGHDDMCTTCKKECWHDADIEVYEAAFLDTAVTAAPSAAITTGTIFPFTVRVTNIGEADAANVKLTLGISGGAVVTSGGLTQNVGSLYGHDSPASYSDVTWMLQCTAEGYTTLNVTASGTDEYGWQVKQICSSEIISIPFGPSFQITCCELVLDGNAGAPIQDGSGLGLYPGAGVRDFINEVSYTVEQSGAIVNPPVGTPVTINLEAGWNLVSVPWYVAGTGTAPNVFFASLGANLNTVYAFDACTTAWSSWNNITGGTLTIDDGKGYWVNVTSAAQVTLTGTLNSTNPLDPLPQYAVCAGWNLIGFKNGSSAAAITAYIDPPLNVASIYTFDNGTWTIPANLVPGQAYWVAFTAGGTIYP